MISIGFNPFILWVKKRIEKNKNVVGLIVGATGSGKSYSAIDFAIKISNELKTKFSIESNVAFDFQDMLRKMQRPENNIPGTVFILEEVGAVGSGGASSEWMSKANAFFSSFLQTSRHRNQILIFTTPNYSLLTKQARQLIHFTIEMTRINPTNNTSEGRFKLTQTNPLSGKTYMKYLRIIYNKKKIAIPFIRFNLPDKSVINYYERVKTDYTDRLNAYILNNGNKKEEMFNKKMIEKQNREEKIKKMIELKEKGVKQLDISKILEVTPRTLQLWAKNSVGETKTPHTGNNSTFAASLKKLKNENNKHNLE